MTDPDRGAYTPQTDAPLAFDARRSRGSGGGGGGPAPFTLIVSAVVLVVVVAAIVMFYRSGVRGSNQAPQVVGSPVDSVKAPPPATEQSGEAAPLDVYNAGADQSAGSAAPAPAFAPAPEQPMARPAPPALPPPVAQPTTPVAAAPLRPAQTAPAPPAMATPAPVALKPAVTPAPKPVAPKPVPPKPAVVAAKPAPAPAPTPKPVVVASSTPAPAAKPAPKPAASGPTGIVVQIGAYSSAALADKGWADAAKLLPGQTAGKTKKVEPVVKGTATLYRAYIGGFASKADAEAYCAAYKAQGKSCFVKG